MTEPILVVDLGFSTTSAIFVLSATGNHPPLKDGSGADAWPTAVYRGEGRWLVGNAATAHRVRGPSAHRLPST